MTETGGEKAVKVAMKKQVFNPHETARVEALAGVPLASFKRRLAAYAIDLLLVGILMIPFSILVQSGLKDAIKPRTENTNYHGLNVQFHVASAEEATKETEELLRVIFAVLYFGLFVWRTNGYTPGKRWLGIRVVSLTHERITLWQACERALGYGASALEAGFGFFQYFIYPNRTCVHDRIAETIVVEMPRAKKMKKE